MRSSVISLLVLSCSYVALQTHAWHMFETDPNRIAFGIMQPIAGNIFGNSNLGPMPSAQPMQNQILTPMTHSRSSAQQQLQQPFQSSLSASFDQQQQQQQQQQHQSPLQVQTVPVGPQNDAPQRDASSTSLTSKLAANLVDAAASLMQSSSDKHNDSNTVLPSGSSATMSNDAGNKLMSNKQQTVRSPDHPSFVPMPMHSSEQSTGGEDRAQTGVDPSIQARDSASISSTAPRGSGESQSKSASSNSNPSLPSPTTSKDSHADTPSPMGPPSPLGKILDSVLSAAAAAASSPTTSSLTSKSMASADKQTGNNSSGGSGSTTSSASSSSSSSHSNRTVTATTSSAERVGQVALQLLKPRKHSHDKLVASAEQQIINQHGRVHSFSPSVTHRRLSLPTKHRDNKLVNTILDSIRDSSSSSSPSDDKSTASSSLGSILDTFKNGISSRSSIVKAISDNKVARTLSTVSKTIGGNKYVAGAAAASALAALGLTMTKLFKPYVFSSGYSKIGDPMMSSSSMLNPSFGYGNTDRTLVYTNPVDSLFSAPKTTASYPPIYIQPDGSYLSSNLEVSTPMTDSNSALSSYDSSASYSQPALQAAASNNNNIFVAYNQVQRQHPVHRQQVAYKSPEIVGGEAGGHYSNFYAQQGMHPAPGEPSLANSWPTSMSPSVEHQYIGTSFQQPVSNEYEYRQYLTPTTSHTADESSASDIQKMSKSQQDPMMLMPTSNDQFYSAAPSSASVPSNARRSGPVPLKLDDATRAQLYDQLERLLKQQAPQQNQYSATYQTGTGQQKIGYGIGQKVTSDRWTPQTQTQIQPQPQPLRQASSGTGYSEAADSTSSSDLLDPQVPKSGRFEGTENNVDVFGTRAAAQPQVIAATSPSNDGYRNSVGLMDTSESNQQYRLLRPNTLTPSTESVHSSNNNGWLATPTLNERPLSSLPSAGKVVDYDVNGVQSSARTESVQQQQQQASSNTLLTSQVVPQRPARSSSSWHSVELNSPQTKQTDFTKSFNQRSARQLSPELAKSAENNQNAIVSMKTIAPPSPGLDRSSVANEHNQHPVSRSSSTIGARVGKTSSSTQRPMKSATSGSLKRNGGARSSQLIEEVKPKAKIIETIDTSAYLTPNVANDTKEGVDFGLSQVGAKAKTNTSGKTIAKFVESTTEAVVSDSKDEQDGYTLATAASSDRGNFVVLLPSPKLSTGARHGYALDQQVTEQQVVPSSSSTLSSNDDKHQHQIEDSAGKQSPVKESALPMNSTTIDGKYDNHRTDGGSSYNNQAPSATSVYAMEKSNNNNNNTNNIIESLFSSTTAQTSDGRDTTSTNRQK